MASIVATYGVTVIIPLLLANATIMWIVSRRLLDRLKRLDSLRCKTLDHRLVHSENNNRAIALEAFVMRRQYLAYEDRALTRIGNLLFVQYLASACIVVVCAVTLLLS